MILVSLSSICSLRASDPFGVDLGLVGVAAASPRSCGEVDEVGEDNRDASESLLAVTEMEELEDRRSYAKQRWCNRGEERRIEEVL